MKHSNIALITGSSGFIGSHLTDSLKKKGYAVFALHRDLLYDPLRLELAMKRIQPTHIFHLAAYGNMSTQTDIVQTAQTNILGTLNLLIASKNIPYQSFVNVSSSSVSLPYETIYSASKASAERLCNAFADEYKKSIVSVRPYSVYGPGEADFRFIPTVIHNLLSGSKMKLSPQPQHDWIYIEDVVNELIHAGELPNVFKTGKLRQCGSGLSFSNQDIVDMLEQISGKKLKATIVEDLRPFDTQHWVADYSINTTVSLVEGLKKTYKYYKQKYEK